MRLFTAGLTFVLLSSTLAAQATRQTTAPTRAKRQTGPVQPAPEPNTVAVTRLRIGRAGQVDPSIAGAITEHVVQGFLDATIWTVLDRSNNEAISNEIEKAMQEGSFNSASSLNLRNQLNAKYVITGNVESILVTPKYAGGQPTRYDATITYTLTMHSVEQGNALVSKSFRVGTVPANIAGARDRATDAAINSIACRLTRTCDKGGTSAASIAYAMSREEAVQKAVANTTEDIKKWAGERATALLGAPATEPAR